MAGSNSWGSQKSHLGERTNRVSVDGKAALLFEVVKCIDDGDGVVTIYNPNQSDYTTITRATTGAAILNDIKFAEFIGLSHDISTINTYSTTVSYGVASVKYINGPTTVAQVQFHHKATGLYHRILVAGKTW